MKANTPDNLDELFESLPEEERLIATVLRELIFETLPDIREKKSYGAPFYFGKKAVCYVWPASITWGGNVREKALKWGLIRQRSLYWARSPQVIFAGRFLCLTSLKSLANTMVLPTFFAS